VEHNPNTPHQGGTKAFKQLTFKEQALSINGSIANLEKAIRYHARFGATRMAKVEREIVKKCIRQLERTVERLKR
jgi:selenocysteine lyase/cysteine desulfurase